MANNTEETDQDGYKDESHMDCHHDSPDGNDDKSFKHELKRKFKITFSPEEWGNIKINSNTRGDRRLSREWAQLFAEKISRVNPCCPLVFRLNRVTKMNTRKTNIPFFTGKASCKFDDCLEYLFIIKNEPKQEKKVKVRVSVDNNTTAIKHEAGLLVGRHISGDYREQVAKEAKQTGSSNTFYSLLGSTDKESLDAGNKSSFGTKAVIRKIASEASLSERLHKDVLLEIALQKELFDQFDDESRTIHGYIQFLSMFPFAVHIYSEHQIEILYDYCKNNSGVLYFDATGAVISKIPDQSKGVFYYPLLIKPTKGDPPLPVAELITNSHTTADISNFLVRFRRDMLQLHQGSPKPKRIEIDFSWAFIHSILLSFNQEDIQTYLNRSWNHIVNTDKWGDNIIVHICSAHVLHKVAISISRLVKENELKRFILYIIGIMINSSTIAELDKCLKNLSIILLCKTEDDHDGFAGSKEILNQCIMNQSTNTADDSETQTSSIFEAEDDKPCNSLFAAHFNSLFHNISSQIKDGNGIANPYYAPDVMKYILKTYMKIAPLWTGLLLEDDLKHDTNAAAECWMKIVKHDILQGKLRLRAGRFIMALHKNRIGRVREYTLMQRKKTTKKTKVETPVFSNEERWGGKKKKKKGVYMKSPAKVPRPKGKKGSVRRQQPDVCTSNSLHWGGQIVVSDKVIHLSNTCPVDNMLVIIHELLAYPNVRQWFTEYSEIEVFSTILEIDSLFTADQWVEGRSIWLFKYCGSPPSGNSWDLFGSEWERFVQHYNTVQQIKSISTCTKRTCPAKSLLITDEQICLESSNDASDRSTLQGEIDRWEMASTKCNTGRCTGYRNITNREFVYHTPPLLILSVTFLSQINGFSSEDLPEYVEILHRKYNIFGYTVCLSGHFKAYFQKDNCWFLYNSLSYPEITALQPTDNRHEGILEHVILVDL